MSKPEYAEPQPPGLHEVFERPGRSWSNQEITACVDWIFKEKSQYLMLFILRHLGSWAKLNDAKDAWSSFCAADFLSVIEKYDPLRGRKFWSFFLLCLKRHCIHYYENSLGVREHFKTLTSEEFELLIDGLPSREQFDRTLEIRDMVQKAINRIKPHLATVLIEYYIRDKSVGQIASEMDAPTGTIKTWLHRAREEMKRALLDLKRQNH